MVYCVVWCDIRQRSKEEGMINYVAGKLGEVILEFSLKDIYDLNVDFIFLTVYLEAYCSLLCSALQNNPLVITCLKMFTQLFYTYCLPLNTKCLCCFSFLLCFPFSSALLSWVLLTTVIGNIFIQQEEGNSII